MQVVSTTITNSRADVIGLALETIAPEVDACIVIDTGAEDDTMAIAEDVLGPKLLARKFEWTGSFADARNFALVCAREVGAAWAVTADTDERLFVPGLRDVCARTAERVNAIMVPHSSDTFGHTRVLRTDRDLQWFMPVHEYVSFGVCDNAPRGWRFECQPRPTENLTRKYHWYRRVLTQWVAENPADGRGWYYLGDTYSILAARDKTFPAEKNLRQAEVCFRNAAERSEWSEQAGWSRYRQAKLLAVRGGLQEAERACIEGVARRSDMAELYWAAGAVRLRMGLESQDLAEFKAALNWADAAIKVGPRPRVSFRWPPAQFELPWQLKAQALMHLGHMQRAMSACEGYKAAYKLRTGHDFVPGRQVDPGLR